MKITFDNRASSSDTLEEVGKTILQAILEKGISEQIELHVTDDESGYIHTYVMYIEATDILHIHEETTRR